MEEFIARLNAAGVRYVVIGGQAVRLHGMPRFSMDWDLLIPARDAGNFERLNAAVGEWLEEPVVAMGPRGENFVQTFQTRHGVVQFHLAVPGIASFDDAESAAVKIPLENGMPCRVLSAEDLLHAKLAAGRSQDQLDAEFLKEKQRN